MKVSADDTSSVDLAKLFQQYGPQKPVIDPAQELKFQAYKELITSRGYFQSFPEGSPEYNDRLQKARDRFFAKFNSQTPATPAPATPTPSVQASPEAEAKGNEHKTRANALLVERKWEEAIAEYTLAINYVDSNAIFFANRAVPLAKLGRYKEAIVDCKKSIALDRTYIKAYSRLGQNYVAEKEYDLAIQALKDGLVVEPGNAQLKADLAKAQAEQEAAKNPNANPFAAMMSGLGGMDGGAGPAGGMPGMPGGGPNLMEMMSDPRFMAMAQNFVMSNPQLRNLAEQVAQNPQVLQQMMQGNLNPDTMPAGFGEQLAAAFQSPDMQAMAANMMGGFGGMGGQGGPGGMGGMQ